MGIIIVLIGSIPFLLQETHIQIGLSLKLKKKKKGIYKLM